MSDTRGGGRRAREGAGGVQSPYKYKYRRRPRLALMSCALPAVNAAPTTAPPRPGLPPGAGGRSHGGLPHPCARQTTHGGLPTPWRRHRALRPRRQGVVCSSHKDSRTRRTTHASKQLALPPVAAAPPPLARDDGGGATAQGIFLRPSRQRLRAAPRWGCRGGGAPAAGRAAPADTRLAPERLRCEFGGGRRRPGRAHQAVWRVELACLRAAHDGPPDRGLYCADGCGLGRPKQPLSLPRVAPCVLLARVTRATLLPTAASQASRTASWRLC